MIDPKQLEELKAKASAFAELECYSEYKTDMLRERYSRKQAFEHAANAKTILSLIAELEQARKDAARYRELKRQNVCGKNESLVVFIDESGNLLPIENDNELDELIDASLSAQEGEGK